MGAGSAGSDRTAELLDSAGASVGLEPRDELLNGELLRESGRAGGASGSGGGRGSRGGDGSSSLGRGRNGGSLSDSGGSSGRCSSSRRGRGSGAGSGRRGNRSSAGDGGGGVAGVRARATTHLEVNAGLVGLVDGSGVPVPLDHAVTGVGALAADIGHSDIERGPVRVLGDGRRGQSVAVPALEGLTNDLVGLDVDDRDVGDTVVGSTDLDLHGNDLTSGVVEDLTSVGKGDTLALPHAAVRVVALEVLERTLDVAVVVGALLVVDLVTAGSLEAIARETGRGGGDEAVGGDGGGEASKGNGGGVGLHFDGWLLS